MEQNSELVEIGKIVDEQTYQREEKGILIDNTINIDHIEEGTILHEVKKTKAIEEAGIWQTKYYLYYLEKRGVKGLHAIIDYPLLRETKSIELEQQDRLILDNIEKNIEEIVKLNRPPQIVSSKVCKKCAYYDLCYI